MSLPPPRHFYHRLMFFYFSGNLRERFWDYKKCCGLQVLGLSMTGSSCCSAGRLLWHARLPTCQTSQESPGRWNAPLPATHLSLLKYRAATPSTASTQRNTLVKMPLSLKYDNMMSFICFKSLFFCSRWCPVWNWYLKRRWQRWKWFSRLLFCLLWEEQGRWII